MRRPLAARVVLLALPLLVLSASPAPASLVDAEAQIRLTERGFSPPAMDVEIGEEIVWVNRSRAEQTLVGEDGSWDSGPLRPGETFTISLREPGTVRYATADGRLEGEIRVNEVAADHARVGGEESEIAVPAPTLPSDGEADAVEAASGHGEDTLPDTGSAAVWTLGTALLLLGAGALLLHRVQDDRSPLP